MNLSAGIVPLRQRDGHWELLLLRCYRYWDFPKGQCSPEEEHLPCALRELQEETTIESIKLPWGQVFYDTEPYARKKVARYFIGVVVEDLEVALLPNPETGVVEHHEYRWVSFDEALRLANPRIKKVIQWVKRIVTGPD